MRAITGLGFQPVLVIVKGDIGAAAVARTPTMPAGLSKRLTDGVALEGAAEHLLSLDANGFTVGGDLGVNSAGITYSWIAFPAQPGLALGSYTGNGADNRSISGLGFRPDLVWVLPASRDHAVFRMAAQSGDASVRFNSSAVGTDEIQALQADGGLRLLGRR